jgi:hypothetical protein
MGIQLVPEQVRRAPLLAVRAVFRGIGRILMVADRPAGAPAAARPAAGLSPLTQRSEDRAGHVLPPPGDQVAPESQDIVGPGVDDEAPRAAELPLPNYDALSLASIRARLRTLDVAQLRVLLDYEAANAERAEVLGMLGRRIEKLEAGA